MRIKKITDTILFDNGSIIYYDHFQSCCEYNYADFKQIEDIAYSYNFDEELIFEYANGGFRFGDKRRMFYIPCYSEQNGYYTNEVDIYYNGKRVLETEGEIILY